MSPLDEAVLEVCQFLEQHRNIRDCLSAFAPYVEEFDLLEVFESCLQAVGLQETDEASSEGT